MSLRVRTDFEDAYFALALLKSIGEVSKDKDYTDLLFRHAYEETNEDFNRQAAALGATGAIKHMFEWGTVGINRGRSDVRPGPLTERARLWTPVLTGEGMNKNLTIAFKPSVGMAPKPTRRDTGMDTDVIESMSDHVFANKAMVMETGSEVTIMQKNAKALLIPLYRNNDTTWASPAERARGFAMRKGSISVTPGRQTQGTFTAFFNTYWNGRGRKRMESDVTYHLEKDFSEQVKRRAGSSLKPIKAHDHRRSIKAAEAKIKKNVKMRARSRNVNR